MQQSKSLVFIIVALFCCNTAHSQESDGAERLAEGRLFLFDGKYDSAILSFKDAKQAFEYSSNSEGVVEAGYGIGEGMLNLGQCDSAIKNITDAQQLSISVFGEAHELTAEGFYTLSRAYGGCSNQPEKAITILDKSLRLRKDLFGETSREIAYDFNMMGYLHNSNGNYDSALNYLSRATEIWENIGVEDSLEYSRTLSFKGEAEDKKGNLREALELVIGAYKIRARHLIADHPTISNSLTDIGNIYRGMGNFDQALNFYLPALEIRKRTLGPTHVNVGGSYYTIGNLYGNISNYRRAIHFIEQGNVIIKARYGEKLPVLHAYYAYLGRMYSYVGNHSEAERLFQLALELAEANMRNDHPYLGTIYGILGDYYSKQGDDNLQKEYLNKALSIYRNVYGKRTTSEAGALVKLGKISFRNDDLESAEKYYNTALDIYYEKVGKRNTGVAGIFQNLGDVSRKKREFDQAQDFYSKSMQAITTDTLNPGETPDFNSLTNRYSALIGIRRIALTYTNMYEESNDTDYLKQSLEQYQTAVKLIDFIISGYRLEESKAQLGTDSRSVFERSVETAWLLYSLTGEETYKETAFRLIEKSKSPILLSRIQDVEAKRFNGVPDRILDEERDLRIELSFYKKKLRDARLRNRTDAITSNQKLVFDTQNTFENFKNNLKENYRSYYDYKYNDRTITHDEIRKYLNGKSAVLEYFVSDTSIYSFIITKKDFELVKLDLPSNFSEILSSYHKCLTDNVFIVEEPAKADSLFVQTAFQAFNRLIKPMLDQASTSIDKLIIVPDGKLSQISFSTFLTETPSTIKFRYNSLSYLLQEYTLSYAYSSTLSFRPASISRDFSFAGFAPSYKAEEYAAMDSSAHPMAYQLVRSGNLPLPGAISEVSAISDLLNGKSWIKEEASETNFKENSGDHSIIHLAMHSLLDQEDPEYSELLFNSEADSLNDGYLTIDEIYNLELKAEMVVLSACSSGGGKIQAGEGPISFTRAFSYAGCPSVIMSMWKIPDAATNEIMIEFYKNIMNGESKNVALRRAQLSYLNRTDNPLYQHPFFWGSFVAMGDTTPVSTSSANRKILAWGISAVVLIGFFRVRKRIHRINR